MFNIDSLDVINGEARDACSYSFVGIKRNHETDRLEFWLPLNFENFPVNDKKEIRKFFFKMYKTLKVFINGRRSNFNQKKNDRDGIIQSNGGLRISYADKDDVICYGKISMIESIVDSYDDMKISSIIRKNFQRENNIDFNKINKYIDKAIYLEDDVIFIDKMQSHVHVIDISANLLVEMYCFIYSEIKKELFESNEVREDVKYIATKFKEGYLTSTSSIFGESFDEAISVLKETLDYIYRQTSYKDSDFWLFFDAIETFLYGEYFPDDKSGDFWGVSNFWAIWEDMCHAYSFSDKSELKNTIIYADSDAHANHKLGNNKSVYINKKVLADNIFYLEYLGEKRYLYPDMVRYVNPLDEAYSDFDKFINLQIKNNPSSDKVTIIIEKTERAGSDRFTSSFIDKLNMHVTKKQSRKSQKVRFDNYAVDVFNKEKESRIQLMMLNNKHNFIIVDYKYHSVSYYYSKSKKIINDIVKQYVYELSIKNWHGDDKTSYNHQFCIPVFSLTQELFPRTEQPDILLKNKIELVFVNFSKLQEFYIQWNILTKN